ncbi:hypothetical protein GM708_07510 [Vibrio cholerae]|nr:hypothetical protein [Vibrio cholerae]
MSFTSLHRVLGLPPSALSYEMLKSAVEQEITEQTDLDWKSETPNTRDPKWREELAKDIAAMANIGGGVIVYGIKEDARSAAAELVDTGPWSDQKERDYRTAIYSHIRPVVQGLEFVPLVADNKTLVVLLIPSSMEIPHFQIKGDFFRAPRRYGAKTEDMTEREIELSYRERFQGTIAREKTLQDMHEDVLSGANRDWIWMTAAGIPATPRPSSLGRLDRSMMRLVMDKMAWNPYLEQSMESRFQHLSGPRIGYRRWRSVIHIGEDIHGAIEVYDDGSFALAFAQYTGLRDFEDGSDIHVMDVHAFPAHVVRLLEAVSTTIGMQGAYELELNMSSNSSPMFVRTYRHEQLVPRDGTLAIHRFHPPRILHDGTTDAESNLEAVYSLTLDLLNQAGIIQVSPLYLQYLHRPQN